MSYVLVDNGETMTLNAHGKDTLRDLSPATKCLGIWRQKPSRWWLLWEPRIARVFWLQEGGLFSTNLDGWDPQHHHSLAELGDWSFVQS